MKKIINRVFVLTLALSGIVYESSAQSDSLTITGDIKGLGDLPVTFTYIGKDGKLVRRDVAAKNGHFVLKFDEQSEPVQAYIGSYSQFKMVTKQLPDGRTVHSRVPILNIFIYRSSLKVKGGIEDLTYLNVTGDKENKEYSDYKKLVMPYEKQIAAINEKTNTMDMRTDSAAIYKLYASSSDINRKKVDVEKNFINEHPGSYASLLLLNNLYIFYTAAQFEETYNNFSGEYASAKFGRELEKRIEKLKVTAVGKQAIDFTRADKDGKTVKLSDFKGKLVLLDFWGSWCGPCRATHPHLKELYAEYKDKGLEIVAVAQEKGKTLEASRASWLAAIEKDGINWVQVMNNDGVETMDIVKTYGITAFPTKVLIDREGKVLMRVTSAATNDMDIMIKKMLDEK